MISFYFLQSSTDSTSWIEKHAVTIGTVIIILIFFAERIWDRVEKKKERRINWYYTVIVQPHITCINNLFINYSNDTSRTFKVISDPGIFEIPELLLESKTTLFNDLSILIQNFDLEFLMIIYAFDMQRYQALTNILSEMHDETVRGLDGGSQINVLLQNIKNKKSAFFNTLYQD